MAMRSEVSFINRDDNRVLPPIAIGGRNTRGFLWRIPATEAITLIQTGLWEFFINTGGVAIDLAVIKPLASPLRLTTTMGDMPFFKLPEYPLCHRFDLAGYNPNERNVVSPKAKNQDRFGLPVGELAT